MLTHSSKTTLPLITIKKTIKNVSRLSQKIQPIQPQSNPDYLRQIFLLEVVIIINPILQITKIMPLLDPTIKNTINQQKDITSIKNDGHVDSIVVVVERPVL